MKVHRNHAEFLEETGHVFWADFATLDIECPMWDGVFMPEEIPELLRFCRENEDYHVMTWMQGGLVLNKLDYSGRMFLLGKGNPDPDLICIPEDREPIWPTAENIKKLTA